MDDRLQRPGMNPDHPARQVLLSVTLAALATGSLLALLVFKGCAGAPSDIRADRQGPGRTFVMTDRHGRVVALFEPGSRRSVSLAPFYTDHCLGLPGTRKRRIALAMDLSLQQKTRHILARGLRAARERLDGEPGRVAGVVVAIEPTSRRVRAMSGLQSDGRIVTDLSEMPRRQAGTMSKPLLVAAALHSGRWQPDTAIHVAPRVATPAEEAIRWTPVNYHAERFQPVTLQQAVRRSMSTPMVRLAIDLDPEEVRDFFRSLGLRSDIPSGPATGLGAVEVDPLELTNAYTTLAAGGIGAQPVFFSLQPSTSRRALGPEQARAVTRMLRLCHGSACKRGSTADGRNGWFVGYGPQLVIGVWIGIEPGPAPADQVTLTRQAEQVWLETMSSAMQMI